jgi:glycosyltransferase involved in cell wall biosynthesis
MLLGAVHSAKEYIPAGLKNVVKPLYDVSIKRFMGGTRGYLAHQHLLEKTIARGRYRAAGRDLLGSQSPKRTIIYHSLVPWDAPLFQRPHHLFLELSKRGYLILFVTPLPAVDRAEPVRRVNDTLFVIRDWSILHDFRDMPFTFWVNWTPNIIYKDLFPESRIVYNYIDELDVFSCHCDLMERDHRQLLSISDFVIASAVKLFDEVRELRNDVMLIPNGVRIEDFQVDADILPDDLLPIVAKKKPIIGYYGALAQWLDYDLINYACEHLPEFNFVMIGPRYDQSSQRLKNHKNLFLLGAKKYSELKHYLRHFDVATIPFRTGRIADSTSPVKLFEYMAGGKPIVTTSMKECARYRSVLVAEGYESYVNNIRTALSLRSDSQYLELLREESNANTWQSRVAEFLGHFERNGA